MVRPAPNRRRDLIDVAAEVFIANGYRRTQMDTVADALGVAKGTLYAYVESKEALFEAAVLYADRLESLPSVDERPLSTPRPGATLIKIRERFAEEAEGLELAKALRRRPSNVTEELARIVRDLFERLARNRRSIKILDRGALDQPELATVWFGDGRRAHLELLAQYLSARSAAGLLRPSPNVDVAARVVLETIVFWAVHRHWDPAPQIVCEDEIPAVITDFLLRGLGKERT